MDGHIETIVEEIVSDVENYFKAGGIRRPSDGMVMAQVQYRCYHRYYDSEDYDEICDMAIRTALARIPHRFNI